MLNFVFAANFSLCFGFGEDKGFMHLTKVYTVVGLGKGGGKLGFSLYCLLGML